MPYLIDANVFIQAKNLHYGLDFCPAFWQWLLKAHEAGAVYSARKVADELVGGNDELANWAATCPESFFLPTEKAIPAFAIVAQWAQSQKYEAAAVSTFLQIADFTLVATAKSQGYVVVFHEVPSASLKRIKIPDACLGMAVECIQPFEMLRRERARFVLGFE